MEQMDDLQKRYLKLLSEKYPTIASASTEIINLSAIMNLPKGTEHALSDIHGEADQFFHVLKNGSGAVRAKIDEEFGNSISMKDKKQLATLIYYPEKTLDQIAHSHNEFLSTINADDRIDDLIVVCLFIQDIFSLVKKFLYDIGEVFRQCLSDF